MRQFTRKHVHDFSRQGKDLIRWQHWVRQRNQADDPQSLERDESGRHVVKERLSEGMGCLVSIEASNKHETGEYLQRLPGKRGRRQDKLQAKANQVSERVPRDNSKKRCEDVMLTSGVDLYLEVLN